jgi:hypothetical protein
MCTPVDFEMRQSLRIPAEPDAGAIDYSAPTGVPIAAQFLLRQTLVVENIVVARKQPPKIAHQVFVRECETGFLRSDLSQDCRDHQTKNSSSRATRRAF